MVARRCHVRREVAGDRRASLSRGRYPVMRRIRIASCSPLSNSVASAAPAFLRHRAAVEKIDEKALISICRLALLACMDSPAREL